MSDKPPSSYDFMPLPDRAPLKFPDGAHVALIFTINIEYWEPFRPGQKEPLFPGGPGDHPACAARRRARHRELDLARVWPAGRHLAPHGGVRQTRRRAVVHLQRHDHGGAPPDRRRGEGARLGARAAQLGAERPAHQLRAQSGAGARGDPQDTRQISKGRRQARQGMAVISDPRHAAHAGLPQGVRPHRLLRLSQRRPAVSDRHHSRPNRLRAVLQRHQRLQHVRTRRARRPGTASTCSSSASINSMPRARRAGAS